MPNTLAHLGVHAVATRAILSQADYKWIYLGCIIPDIPWILQRLAKITSPEIDVYDLRLFAVVQASLLFCLLLSSAIAMVSPKFWKTFCILGLGSFYHLLLDAFQTKWANGVHFLVPFDWQLINFGFFWPESLPTYFLTAFGLIYLIINWKRASVNPIRFFRPSKKCSIAGILLFFAYMVCPLFLLQFSEKADNHYVGTLRNIDNRLGRYVECDRAFHAKNPSERIITTFSGEKLKTTGIEFDHSALVSIRGNFLEKNLIHVTEFHEHTPRFRDKASYLGLILVTFLWLWTIVKKTLYKHARA